MGPRKDTQKRRRHDGEGSSRGNEQAQHIHPLASWFNNSKALETFISKWEKRQFVSPRYITLDFLVGHNYTRLIEVIENQGFGTLIAMQNDYYPDLTIASISHMKYSPSNEGGYIEGYIGGRYRVVPLTTIASLCGLSMEGYRFMGGLHPHESWGPYQLRDGLNRIGYNDPYFGKQRLSVNKLSTEMRILHYLITYTLLPRGGNHGIIQHDDVFLMWTMVQDHKICWSFIMVQNMLSLQGRESKHVGYGPVWSRIFEHLGVNIQGYTRVQMNEGNMINERTLKQMRRELQQVPQGVDEDEEEVNRVQQEEQNQPLPQDQVTMEALIRETRSMNRNMQEFQMEVRGHYEAMNTRLESVEGRVQAIQNYIGVEYKPQDDQDDHET
ncbi:hypothetical protein PIB30_101621 [Stylosanthes scabra]|uniref:Uncharacterized protein n=1 Tax=Stylosanthes scabra TaxID=79078 RepID=A0ABU6YV95_9FABA|nr:hypothetical protein [Stylosanthes scabra]